MKKILNNLDYILTGVFLILLAIYLPNLMNGNNKLNIEFMVIKDYVPFMLGGIGLTISLAIVSSVSGTLIGLLLAVMQGVEGPLKRTAQRYINLFRGTPLLLQLFFIYYAIPQLTGYKFDAFIAAALAFSLNSGAYTSEIIRAGIESVDKGEIEAAKCLGVKKKYIYLDLIIPQAFKTIFPAIVNEFIVLIKESSIVFAIGLKEMMTRFRLVQSAVFKSFEPLIFVGILYFVIIRIFTKLLTRVEGRLKNAAGE